MAEINERVARLEADYFHIKGTLDHAAGNIDKLVSSVSKIEIALAKDSGGKATIRYFLQAATHLLTGVLGVLAGKHS